MSATVTSPGCLPAAKHIADAKDVADSRGVYESCGRTYLDTYGSFP